MNCPSCNSEIKNAEAKFCSSCGTKLPELTKPEKPRTDIAINQDVSTAQAGSDVTGLRVEQVQGEVHIQSNQVVLQASEGTNLKLLESISTEIKTQTAAGVAGSKLPERLDEANDKLDSLLKLLRDRESVGQRLEGVTAAGTRISRVDLLLKKAALLKINAEQMMLDHVERNKGRFDTTPGQVDMEAIFEDFDSAAYDSTLNEAKDLLDEARSLEPSNTEVLLHLAELLIQVTVDDPSDERRVLYEVQSLLRNPKDDVERFRLAQATFLLATSHEPMDTNSLRDAREMFASLGRNDWTRHCDDLLASEGSGQVTSAGHGMTAPPQQFTPHGAWNVQIMDAFSSTMQMTLNPDGQFAATQYVPAMGTNLQVSGGWFFNPMNSLLQLQGLIGGMQPFMLGITVQGWQGDGFFGVGTDGIAYILRQA